MAQSISKNFFKSIIRSSKNLSIYFLAALVPMIISLVLNPFVSLNMEKGDFAITGYYSSFNLLVLPLTAFSFLQYYSKSYFKFGDKERQTLLNTLQSSTLLFGSAALALTLFAYYIYQRNNRISIPFMPFAILSFTTVYLGTFYSVLLTKLKFERKAGNYFGVSMMNSVIHASLIITLVICLKYRAYGYMWASLIGAGIMCVYSLCQTMTKFEINKKMMKGMVAFCWPLVIANLMEFVYTGIDRSFLVRLDNNQELGLYNVAVSIGTYVMVFYTAIAQTFQPDIFENVSKKNLRGTLRTIIKMFVLNFVPIIVFIILAPFLIDILTYGRFTDATPYARVIALKGVFAGLYFSLTTVIIAGGLSKITLLNKSIGTIVVYFLTAYLITNYTYLGAAWSQALSYTVMVILTIFFIVIKRKTIFS